MLSHFSMHKTFHSHSVSKLSLRKQVYVLFRAETDLCMAEEDEQKIYIFFLVFRASHVIWKISEKLFPEQEQ